MTWDTLADRLSFLIGRISAPTASQDYLTDVEGVPVVVLPPGHEVHPFNDLATPHHVAATVHAHTESTFAAYVAGHHREETAIFADQTSRRITCVIDYYECTRQQKTEPGVRTYHRGLHRCVYDCPASLQWQAWSAQNEQWTNQEGFARFLEENKADLAEPDWGPEPKPATVIETALALEAKRSAHFKQSTRLASGSRSLIWEETTTASVAGELEVPEYFQIALPLFLEGPTHRLTARLEYRIREGHLALRFVLLNAEHAVQQAFSDTCKALAKQLPKGVALYQAEAPR